MDSMKKDRLIIRGGARDGLTRELPPPPATLHFGRGPGNDIQFDAYIDKLVGRQHARVEVRRDGVYPSDENSANGTFLMSPQGPVDVVPEVKVRDGDKFRLGSEGAPCVVFELAASDDSLDLPPTFVGIKAEAPGPIAVQASRLPPSAADAPHRPPPGRMGDTVQGKAGAKPGRMGDTLVSIGSPPPEPTLNPKQAESEAQTIAPDPPQAPAETIERPSVYEVPTQVKLHQVGSQVTPKAAAQSPQVKVHQGDSQVTPRATPQSETEELPKESQPQQMSAGKPVPPTHAHPWAEYRTQGVFIAVVLMFACLIGLGMGFSGMLSSSPPSQQEVAPN